MKHVKQKPETHHIQPEHITFDPSWFKALHDRKTSPADITDLVARDAYAKYLRELQVIAPK